MVYDPTVGRFLTEDPSGLLVDPNPYRYVSNSPTNFTDPTGLAEQKVGKVTNVVFVNSKDDIPKLDPAISFTNPTGVNYDLNTPGPFVDAKKRDAHNVHWVVFEADNIDDVEVQRYATGTFMLNGTPLTPAQSQIQPPIQGGKFPVVADKKYIDPIQAKELCKKKGYIAIADAPGLGKDAVTKDFVTFDYTWHFYVTATSKSTHKLLGGVMYDVNVAGQFVEGQFLGVTTDKGTNTAKTAVGPWWPK
jgi:hypothetical protein